MFPTSTKAAAQKLGAEAERVFNDPRLSSGQKNIKLKSIQGRLADLERKGPDMSWLASSGDDPGVTGGPGNGFGARVGAAAPLRLDEPSMKALFDAAESRQSLAVKATVATPSVDPSTFPVQFLPPVSFLREPTRVADLLPSVAVDRGQIEFYVTSGSTGAAVTSEATLKPASAVSYTRKSASVTKIAHWVQASEEALSDYPAFVGLVSQDMVSGVILAENAEVLNGTGIGGHLTGLLTAPGILTRTQTTTGTALDTVESAITDLRSGSRFAEPDGMVMAPSTFSKLRQSKDSQGRYLASDPVAAAAHSLWGTPVVITTTCPANTVLIGAFKEAAVLFVREGVTVRTSSGGDSFRSNLFDIIAEERVALAVVAPAALMKVTLS